jgi:hypothetical protein
MVTELQITKHILRSYLTSLVILMNNINWQLSNQLISLPKMYS